MIGWEIFTDRVINLISQNKKILFLFYGVLMHKKKAYILIGIII